MVKIDKLDHKDNVKVSSHYGIDDQDGSISSKESLVGPVIQMTQDSAVRHSNLFGSGDNLTAIVLSHYMQHSHLFDILTKCTNKILKQQR